jgi:hypothetical protein
MKKLVSVALVVLTIVAASATPSLARGGHGGPGGGHFAGGGRVAGHAGFRGHVVARPAFRHHARVFVGVSPFVVAPFWWDYPPYVAAPPVVVQQSPPVYVEQEPPAQPAPQEWYYCQSANAYYPNVTSCPEPWVRVPAQ